MNQGFIQDFLQCVCVCVCGGGGGGGGDSKDGGHKKKSKLNHALKFKLHPHESQLLTFKTWDFSWDPSAFPPHFL